MRPKDSGTYGGQGSVVKRLTRRDHACHICGAAPRERCVNVRAGENATGKYSAGAYGKPLKHVHPERGRDEARNAG